MYRSICYILADACSLVDSDLKALAQEVLDLIKGLVGRETFSRAYASLQQTAAVKRETRKRKEALEVRPIMCKVCSNSHRKSVHLGGCYMEFWMKDSLLVKGLLVFWAFRNDKNRQNA